MILFLKLYFFMQIQRIEVFFQVVTITRCSLLSPAQGQKQARLRRSDKL